MLNWSTNRVRANKQGIFQKRRNCSNLRGRRTKRRKVENSRSNKKKVSSCHKLL